MKFKKLNLIIGKRQIIIVSLLVTLSVAAFLNWQFATGDQSIAVDEKKDSTTYGETALVGKNTKIKEQNDNKQSSNKLTNFIEQIKTTRDNTYEQKIEDNKEIIDSDRLKSETIEAAAKENKKLFNYQKASKHIETELMGKSKGKFKKTAVVISTDQNNDNKMDEQNNDNKIKVNVYIETPNQKIDEDLMILIRDTVTKNIDIEASGITITPVVSMNKN